MLLMEKRKQGRQVFSQVPLRCPHIAHSQAVINITAGIVITSTKQSTIEHDSRVGWVQNRKNSIHYLNIRK